VDSGKRTFKRLSIRCSEILESNKKLSEGTCWAGGEIRQGLTGVATDVDVQGNALGGKFSFFEDLIFLKFDLIL
jgi:hypothetical protein